jgi:hypothetical protein
MSLLIKSCYENKNDSCEDGTSYCDYIKNKVPAYFDGELTNFDYEIILREPLPNKHAVYIFFERIFRFLCGCGFCANSQN